VHDCTAERAAIATVVSAINGAISASSGSEAAICALCSSAACVVAAPIATSLAPTLMPFNSLSSLTSISTSGVANRSFIIGNSE
jgi:hypothetical protein